MTTEAPQTREMLQRLAGRTYSAGELIAACDISADVLTNYLTKSKIELCSVSEGRGKSRKFHLLDVYAIALMNELVFLTRNQDFSARLIEKILFGDLFHPELGKNFFRRDESIASIRADYVKDIFNANPLFVNRGASKILLVPISSIDHMIYQFDIIDAAEENPWQSINIHFLQSGYFMNTTSILLTVDARINANSVGEVE